MAELLNKEEVFAIVGAAMAVHRELGSGFLEAVYHEAMEIEMRLQGITFQTHVALPLVYRGVPLQKRYEADLIVDNAVLVELKAIQHLGDRETAQVLHYLKATGIRVGLLINFGAPSLEWKRLVK
jgi:GxxExxY protein